MRWHGTELEWGFASARCIAVWPRRGCVRNLSGSGGTSASRAARICRIDLTFDVGLHQVETTERAGDGIAWAR